MKNILTSLVLQIFRLTSLLPSWCTRKIGRLFGLILYSLNIRNTVVQANLLYCFPELSRTERHNLCKEHFKSLGEGFFETNSVWRKPYCTSSSSHTISGLSHYKKAQKTGKSIIFVGYHSTHLEYALACLSKHISFSFFYRPNENKDINKFIQSGREKHFSCLARTANLDKGNMHAITEHLGAGNNLLLLPDQDFGYQNTCFAPFYDKPMATLKSPFQIAKVTDSVILPVNYYKDVDQNMQLCVLPELKFSGDELQDCTQLNKILQQAIQPAPEQYYWVHRRFKTLPDGQRPIYFSKKLKPLAINAQQHDGALYSGKILARAQGLPKLVRTLDGQILNSFSRNTSFGIEITQKEILRMLDKINQFNFRGFYSISPNEFTYCAERQAYMLRYNELPGVSISSIEPAQQEALAILLGHWLGQLHREGIALNAFKASNIELLPNKNFALLNPVQCEFFDHAVSVKKASKDIELLFQEIEFLQKEKSTNLFKKQYAKANA